MKTDSAMEISDFEDMIGYVFLNKETLKMAFTHFSYSKQKSLSYQTLTFLGDATLKMLLALEHYSLYPTLSSDDLTLLGSVNMDTDKLARVAVRHGFHRFLRHRIPSLEEQIQTFTREICDYPLHSNGQIHAPKVLAHIVKSAIGGVYKDSNYSEDIVWKVFKPILEPHIRPDAIPRNPVTELYRYCRKKNKQVMFDDQWAQNGAFNVFVDGVVVGTGSYARKKAIARCRAAKNGLDNVQARVKPDSKM